MKIISLKTNHLVEPLGYDFGEKPVVTWKTVGAKAKRQKWARVEVAADKDFKTILHDSGKEASLDSLGYALPIKLLPRTRYFWRVTVAAGTETASAISFFETGKMAEKWAGSWIVPENEMRICRFKNELTIPAGKITDARLYCAAVGCYEATINGEPVNDEVLLPGYHSFHHAIHAQTFDVTELLAAGNNTIALHVGPGWIGSELGWVGLGSSGFCGQRAIVCELRAKVGGKETILAKSDENWCVEDSQVVESGIYHGEDLDFTIETKEVGKVRVIDDVPSCDRLSPPIRVIEALSNPEVIKTPAGETVLDFQQEITGWIEVRNTAPAGTKCVLECAEILQDGNFFRENYRAARAAFTYISDGTDRLVRPFFTFFGFRYLRLTEGFENVDPANFRALVIHSDIEQVGSITTSNPKLNRLWANVLWGQRGNFLDVPTDCPQRDERLGWTGDTQVFSGTACYNMDTASFYTKFIADLRIAQNASFVPKAVTCAAEIGKQKDGTPWPQGAVPSTVPFWPPCCNIASAWSDVAAVVPWTVYERYGDKELLRRQYPAMRAWVEYLRSVAKGNLWENAVYGDWLNLETNGNYTYHYISTAYYALSTKYTLWAAMELGLKADVARYEKQLAAIKQTFAEEFFTPAGRCVYENSQTAHAIALAFDLVPEKAWKRCAERLAFLVEEWSKTALTTGFVGLPVLQRALCLAGRSDLAYGLLLREEYPGWLFEVNMGATTIWERWNGLLEDGKISDVTMNSFNHYAYGAVMEWGYTHVCGLRPATPGFRKALIAPVFDKRLKRVAMSFDSPAGLYKTSWKWAGKKVTFTCEIPFNCSARLELPGLAAKNLDAGKYTFTVDAE